MEKKLIITKGDLDKDNFYKHNFIDTDTEIIIEESLGFVRIKQYLKTTKNIWIKAGTGISAGWGISAGGGISAGEGISAGWGISAGGEVEEFRKGNIILGNLIIKGGNTGILEL